MKLPLATISVARLTSADIDEAFGLARLAFSDLTPGRWRQIAQRWAKGERASSGALLARDGAGRLVGLAPYVVRADLCAGKTLWVEKVLAFSLVDAGPVVIALADSLRDAARARSIRKAISSRQARTRPSSRSARRSMASRSSCAPTIRR